MCPQGISQGSALQTFRSRSCGPPRCRIARAPILLPVRPCFNNSFNSLLHWFSFLSWFHVESVKWRALRALRALVPSMLACPRALVSSCLNFRRALVPSMLTFRTLLRDVTLEMFLESLKLSDPFFLNFIRKNLSREFEVKNLKLR